VILDTAAYNVRRRCWQQAAEAFIAKSEILQVEAHPNARMCVACASKRDAPKRFAALVRAYALKRIPDAHVMARKASGGYSER
jgi:hypothetical protein